MANALQQKLNELLKFRYPKILGLFLLLVMLSLLNIRIARSECPKKIYRDQTLKIINSIELVNQCTLDIQLASDQTEFNNIKKLKQLQSLGDVALPYLIETITSDKKEQVFKGGLSFVSLCGISIISKNKINWNKVDTIISNYYKNRIYSANYPYVLKKKIQNEIILQLNDIKCINIEKSICCQY